MTTDSQRQLNRFIDGFVEGEELQTPPGPDGDPQLAALDQYLLGQKSRLSNEDAILDVGSGLGVAAYRIDRVWSKKEVTPLYYALDFPDELEKLSLPTRIHNRSRKFNLEALTGGVPSADLDCVKLVIVRNVLHHLHILDTGRTLTALRKLCQNGAEVYIQDMEFLPRGERINIGWAPDILESLFVELGFRSTGVLPQRSRSGTPWYMTTLSDDPTKRVLRTEDAADLVLQKRRSQLERRTTENNTLADSQETVAEFFSLQDEIASLTSQILSYTNGKSVHSASVCDVPLKTNDDSDLEYFEEIGDRGSVSGLQAVLSSKRLIDIASLITGATERLWFMGYSQRILFSNSEISEQLKAAVERGVNVRILLADPLSEAVAARSKASAYVNRNLMNEVAETINGFWALKQEMIQLDFAHDVLDGFEIALSDSQISCSFFIADQTCIASLYSANLTGGDGAALVLKAGQSGKTGYYHALVREFQGIWASSAAMTSPRNAQ